MGQMQMAAALNGPNVVKRWLTLSALASFVKKHLACQSEKSS